jgi:hypothetical protein
VINFELEINIELEISENEKNDCFRKRSIKYQGPNLRWHAQLHYSS